MPPGFQEKEAPSPPSAEAHHGAELGASEAPAKGAEIREESRKALAVVSGANDPLKGSGSEVGPLNAQLIPNDALGKFLQEHRASTSPLIAHYEHLRAEVLSSPTFAASLAALRRESQAELLRVAATIEIRLTAPIAQPPLPSPPSPALTSGAPTVEKVERAGEPKLAPLKSATAELPRSELLARPELPRTESALDRAPARTPSAPTRTERSEAILPAQRSNDRPEYSDRLAHPGRSSLESNPARYVASHGTVPLRTPPPDNTRDPGPGHRALPERGSEQQRLPAREQQPRSDPPPRVESGPREPGRPSETEQPRRESSTGPRSEPSPPRDPLPAPGSESPRRADPHTPETPSRIEPTKPAPEREFLKREGPPPSPTPDTSRPASPRDPPGSRDLPPSLTMPHVHPRETPTAPSRPPDLPPTSPDDGRHRIEPPTQPPHSAGQGPPREPPEHARRQFQVLDETRPAGPARAGTDPSPGYRPSDLRENGSVVARRDGIVRSEPVYGTPLERSRQRSEANFELPTPGLASGLTPSPRSPASLPHEDHALALERKGPALHDRSQRIIDIIRAPFERTPNVTNALTEPTGALLRDLIAQFRRGDPSVIAAIRTLKAELASEHGRERERIGTILRAFTEEQISSTTRTPGEEPIKAATPPRYPDDIDALALADLQRSVNTFIHDREPADSASTIVYDIRGRAISATTGLPIDGAVVNAGRFGWQTTSIYGEFCFANVPAGSAYTLTVSKPHHEFLPSVVSGVTSASVWQEFSAVVEPRRY